MTELSYHVEPLATISPKTVQAWHRLREANPALYSPYFHPDYALHVARLVKGCNVVVTRRGADVVALLPLQGTRSLRPIGAPMTDYHGIICAGDAAVSLSEMIKAAGGRRFRSDAWVGSEAAFSRPESQTGSVIDFGDDGAQSWVAAQGKSFRKHRSDIMRRRRKAVEEFGPMKTVFRSVDPDVLDMLIRWKSEQFAQQGLYDVLSVDWTRALLHNLLQSTDDSALRLDLHTVSFGDRIAAIDCGLTDGDTYHRWIIAYDAELQQYSPGSQILTELISAEDAPPYRRIDHGVGDGGYKHHYNTHPVAVQQGLATKPSLSSPIARAFDAVEQGTQDKLGDWPGRIRRRYSQIAACERHLVPTWHHMGRSSLQVLSGSRSH